MEHSLEILAVSAEEKETMIEIGEKDRCGVGSPGSGTELLFFCSSSSWN